MSDNQQLALDPARQSVRDQLVQLAQGQRRDAEHQDGSPHPGGRRRLQVAD